MEKIKPLESSRSALGTLAEIEEQTGVEIKKPQPGEGLGLIDVEIAASLKRSPVDFKISAPRPAGPLPELRSPGAKIATALFALAEDMGKGPIHFCFPFAKIGRSGERRLLRDRPALFD